MVDAAKENSLLKAIRDDDESPFFEALSSDEDVLRFAGVFGSWLHYAAMHGRLGIIKRLLSMGLDINERGGVHDGSALDLAASEGHYEVVKYLLERGAAMDVDEPSRNPLFGAIYGGHTAIAKLLVDKGIDTRVRYTGDSMKDIDAIAFAKKWGRGEIVKLLEERV